MFLCILKKFWLDIGRPNLKKARKSKYFPLKEEGIPVYLFIMSKDLIKKIIVDFHQQEYTKFFSRDLDVPIDVEKIITLIGPRRSGKTAQLFNMIHELMQAGVSKKNIIYINFEDERIDYFTPDLDDIMNAYLELYPEVKLENCYLFFDEIQNIDSWDKYVRRMYDTVTKHIFVSGSNAKLLSKDIATSLRGRTLTYQVLPLSFKEFCTFKGVELDFIGTRNRSRIIHELDTYLEFGGFPEIISFDNDLKIKTLQEYFNTMVYRDIVERYNVKNTTVLKYFLKRLFASATKNMSINKMYNEIRSAGMKIAKQQLYDYLDNSESIYLASVLKKYSSTIVNQELGERKIYIIDNGLLNAISFKFSDDAGKSMEQAVYQELMRRGHQVYFFKDKQECDFVVVQGHQPFELIQVCYSLDDTDTREREIGGLAEACDSMGLKTGLIITKDKKESIERNGVSIKVVPLFEWLLK